MNPKKKLLAAAVSMVICAPVLADPPAVTNLPDVFCFRITDVERVAGDAEADRFLFEFEVLNWTNQQAAGISLATNVGTSAGVTLAAASVDPDGRGGTIGDINDPAFGEIGAGTFDPVSHQSGRGRGDIAGHLNDWTVLGSSPTGAVWSALDGTANLVGTQIPNQDLIFGGKNGQVPGTGLDALGDTAIDGGPGPYTSGPQDGDPQVAGAPPSPDGSGNVLDGFVIDVDGFGEGDTLSFNWNLLGINGDGDGGPSLTSAVFDYGGFCGTDPAACLFSIGTQFGGNSFGFGTISLARVATGDPLPGALFTGNSGFNQNPTTFFDSVWQVPNPTDFGAEFGAGLTAPFRDPADNLFGNVVNTQPQLADVPEPATIGLTLVGLAGLFGRRRRRKASET